MKAILVIMVCPRCGARVRGPVEKVKSHLETHDASDKLGYIEPDQNRLTHGTYE